MSNDIVNIGGIMFNKNDVLSSSSMQKKGALYNGKPVFSYKVETTHGTYTYTDQHPVDKNETASIFVNDGKVTIDNCILSTLQGTENRDRYTLLNSILGFADIAGDENSDKGSDSILLRGNSSLGNVNKDVPDRIGAIRSFPTGKAIHY